MQPAVAGIGVTDVFLGNALSLRGAAVNQVQELIVELLPLGLRYALILILVFQEKSPRLKSPAQIL